MIRGIRPRTWRIFSDEHRFDTMLEVELLAAEGLAQHGVLPQSEVDNCDNVVPLSTPNS